MLLKRLPFTLLQIGLPTAVFVCVLLVSVPIAATRATMYEAQARIWVTTFAGMRSSDHTGGIAAPTPTFFNSPIETASEIIRSGQVIREAVKLLHQRMPNDQVPDEADILDGLTAVPIKDTDILIVKFRARQPNQSAQILQTILDACVSISRNQNSEAASAQRAYLQAQLSDSAAKLAKASDKLSEYQKRHSISDFDEHASRLLDRWESAEQDLQEASEAVTNKQAAVEATEGKLKKAGESSTLVEKALEEKAADLQLQLMRATNLKPGHPMRIRLERERKKLVDDLARIRSTETGDWRVLKDELDTAKNELGKLQRDREMQVEHIRQLEEERAKLPMEAVEWSELKRQKDLATAEVANLDQRLNEAQLFERISQGLTNIKIIDNPVRPVYPVGPSKPLIIAICALAGGVLAGMIYVLLGRMNPLLLTMNEAQAILPLPIAGVFPLLGELEPGHVERLRRFISKHMHGHKRIIVISPGPQEGKTTVATALARSFAEAAKKVILVDANQLAPAVHRQFGQRSMPGLHECVKKDAEVDPSVKINKYLSIVRCGQCPADLNIFEEQWTMRYLETLENESDFVIYDATAAARSAMYLTLLEHPALIVVVARLSCSAKEGLRLLRSHLRDYDHCQAFYIFTDANEADIPAKVPSAAAEPLVLPAVTTDREEQPIW